MESKKLPVVWLRSEDSQLRWIQEDDSNTRHGYFVIDKEATFNEPYIPARRVRKLIAKLQKQIEILEGLPYTQTELWCAVSHLKKLIADVDDDGLTHDRPNR